MNQTEAVDEWKLFQVDTELPDYDAKERIEVFWKGVFQLQSPAGDPRYKVLPFVVKSALILAQTNAESERSLSINARIVTKDRASLSEQTIVGLHIVKEAVRFFDPDSMRPECVPVDTKLKQAVRSASAAYKECLQRDKELEKKKKEEERLKKETSEKEKKERSRLLQKKESLSKSEEDLSQQERSVREEMRAADELMKDATKKLEEALAASSVNKTSVSAAKMMLDTATEKREQATSKLDKIRAAQKSLGSTTHKLLNEVLPSKQGGSKKRKGLETGEKKEAKKAKK